MASGREPAIMALVRISLKGHEHFVVIGLLDCAVIQVPDTHAGEVPKAFIVKPLKAAGKSDAEAATHKHIEENKCEWEDLEETSEKSRGVEEKGP
ncbi:hypothetical protein GGR58DRAFT_505463 [Xylaria digitata]|nr:hypothetical protein GGR58DRAFT_505463 [Xylaria digitata]